MSPRANWLGNSLDELSSYMRPLAVKLLSDAAKAGIPCRVVDTGRTPSEQAVKIMYGVSWTENSRHLPQPPEGKSEAVDLVPQEILDEHKSNWSPDSPLWARLGAIGENLGLTWGG